MNVGEIKRRVFKIVGDEAGVLFDANDILDWANEAQIDIARKTESLVSATPYTWSTVIGQESYDLPADFLLRKRLTLDGILLTPSTQEDMDKYFGDRETVEYVGNSLNPSRYYILGQALFLWPPPVAAGSSNLKLWYVYSPPALVEDASVSALPLQYHTDIVRYCLARAKELNEEEDVAQIMQADYESKVMFSKAEAADANKDSYPAVRTLIGDDGDIW